MIRLLLLVALIAAVSCSGADSLVYPDAEEIRQVSSSSAVLYEESGADNACPTSLTTYGTDDGFEDVLSHYAGIDFEALGESTSSRWVGERDGDRESWRQVDISAGEVAGHPEWATVFELAAPACGA